MNQKMRTRAELLRAARELAGNGAQPSVADVADHAKISRATAYRYFSTAEDMIREALLDAVASSIRITPQDGSASPEDVQAQIDDLVLQIFAMVTEHEQMFRAFLAGTVAGKAPDNRGGRRLVWLEAALAPLRPHLAPAAFDRLLHGLALVTGIETLVVLKDICGLDASASRDVTRWVARTLLEGATQTRD